MNPLRIALIVHGWPAQKFGGVGLYVERLARGLHEQGQDVTIIAPQRGTHYTIHEEKQIWGTLILVRIPTPKNWSETWSQNPSSLQFLFSHLRFDVVHVHHLGLWPLDLAQYIAHRRLLITLHDYAIICGRGQLYHPHNGICEGPTPSKCVSCQRAHLTHTTSVHRLSFFLEKTLFQHYPQSKETLKRLLSAIPARKSHIQLMGHRQKMAMQTLNSADAILAPSEDIIRRTSPYCNTTMTLSPLPLLRFFDRSPLPPLPYQFVFASTIIPTKGLHILLEAMEQLPSAKLIVAGHPAEFESWPNYAAEQLQRINTLPNCTYVGALSHDAIQEVLSSSHCLVLPSLWPENSPIIIREALSVGLEVICSEKGGAKELSPTIHTICDVADLYPLMKQLMNAPRRVPPIIFPSVMEHTKTLLSLYTASRF